MPMCNRTAVEKDASQRLESRGVFVTHGSLAVSIRTGT